MTSSAKSFQQVSVSLCGPSKQCSGRLFGHPDLRKLTKSIQVLYFEVVKAARQSRVDMQDNQMAFQWLSCHLWHAPFCVSCLIHRLFPLLSFARVHKLLINSHSNSAHLVAGPSASLDHQQGCQLAARRSSSASSLPHRANSDATISIPRC